MSGIIVDVSAPGREMIFPVFEAVLITGVVSIGVGYLDRPGALGGHPPQWMHLLALAVWVLLMLWRFVIPLARQRRRRIVITPDELCVYGLVGYGRQPAAIPLRTVVGAYRQRSTLMVQLTTTAEVFAIPRIARTRKVAAVLTELADYHRARTAYEASIEQ